MITKNVGFPILCLCIDSAAQIKSNQHFVIMIVVEVRIRCRCPINQAERDRRKNFYDSHSYSYISHLSRMGHRLHNLTANARRIFDYLLINFNVAF